LLGFWGLNKLDLICGVKGGGLRNGKIDEIDS
jgi:hypothetical protein